MIESFYWGLFWLVLGYLYVQWRLLWIPFFLENFRNKIFILRDELFDYYLNNNLDFNSSEYTKMRELMNATLRFGHRISFFDYIWVRYFVPEFKDLALRTEQNINQIFVSIQDTALRDYYEDLHFRLNLNIVKFIVCSSPILLIVLIFLFCFFAIHDQIKQAPKKTIDWFSKNIEPQIECSDYLAGNRERYIY